MSESKNLNNNCTSVPSNSTFNIQNLKLIFNNSKFNIQNSKLKIFVAGGTGLVGSALIRKLIEKGYTNIIANYHNRAPIEHLTHNITDSNTHIKGESVQTHKKDHLRCSTNHNLPITWLQLNLTDQKAVIEFFEKHRPDIVFLAAAKVGGIVANNTYRADFIYENLQIQNNVIHFSYKYGVRKLLFLGSTCIYPKNCPQPIKEEYLLTSELEYTNEPYAIAKIAGIKMCESYNLQYGTNFISVMPTNLYGPYDNFDLEKSHVLPALIRKFHLTKLLREKRYDEVVSDLKVKNIEEAREYLLKFGVTENSVEIWGTGKPRREFLYSDDMADACVFLMENVDFQDLVRLKLNHQSPIEHLTKISTYQSPVTNNNLPNTNPQSLITNYHSPVTTYQLPITNTHINLGTGKDLSIKELAELIKDIVGFDGDIVFNPSKPDGTFQKLTDVSKLHSLGWKHKVELEEGIKMVYEWYKNC